MASIKDSTKTTIAEHSIKLRVSETNLLNLSAGDAAVHLEMLAGMLEKAGEFFPGKLPSEGGGNEDFLQYLDRLRKTVRAAAFKNKLESERRKGDIRLNCAIDPSDSGFPVVVRDFKFLNTDMEKAAEELKKLPKDERLVDEALFLLFRGHFPKDAVLQKMEREYYETIEKLALPETLKIHPEELAKSDSDFHYYKQSFERLDDHSNLPRFYTIYYRVPEQSIDRTEWKSEMDRAIREGLSTVTNLELGFLAKGIEEIEGVMADYIERFDVGPFYNRFTENKGPLGSLVESEDECLMTFRKYSVVRASEKKRTGFKNWLKIIMSGDTHLGEFSPAITSPHYVLMPHRLVQRAHAREVSLVNTKMFGITAGGEIHD